MRYIYFVLFFSFQSMVVLGQLSVSDSLLLRFDDEKNDTARINLLMDLGSHFESTNSDSTLFYFKKALKLSVDKSIDVYQAYCNSRIADVYFVQSEYNEAIGAHLKSLNIYKKLNDERGICIALSNVGIAYWEKGDFEKCNECYLQALAIAESRQDTLLCTKIKINIALVFDELGDKENALKYHLEALRDLEKINDVDGVLASLQNIGCAKQDQGKYDEAIAYFNRALALALKENDLYLVAMSYSNLASTYEEKEDFDAAIKYNKKGIEYYNKVGNDKGIARCNIYMASVLLQLKNYKESEQYSLEALKIAKDKGVEDIEKHAYEMLARSCAEMKQFSKAYTYQNKFIQLKDSIYTKEKSQQILELQAQFESEKKEKENALLTQANIIQELEIDKQISWRNSFVGISFLVIVLILILLNRYRSKKRSNLALLSKNELIQKQKEELLKNNDVLVQQYAELKLLNATKDKFFKIISHDLKSPFNAIIGFSQLLKQEYDDYSDAEKKEFIENINQASELAYELLGNLLTWAQSQTGEIKITKEIIHLKGLVEKSIAPYLPGASRKNIKVKVDIPSSISLLLDKNTSMTFFANLVNNAIKFTPNGGKITITTTATQKNIEVHIIDTGVGIPPQIISKLFKIDEAVTSMGTNNEKGTGLGLILCKEFIELNGGSITLRSEINKGSEFIVSLPGNVG